MSCPPSAIEGGVRQLDLSRRSGGSGASAHLVEGRVDTASRPGYTEAYAVVGTPTVLEARPAPASDDGPPIIPAYLSPLLRLSSYGVSCLREGLPCVNPWWCNATNGTNATSTVGGSWWP